MASENTSWKHSPERGNLLGIKILVWTCCVFGRKAVHSLLLFITLFFVIFAAKPRAHSKSYLQRIYKIQTGFFKTFKHFYWFARTSVDRVFFLKGQLNKFEISFEGDEIFKHLNPSQGALLLLSHIGNFDALRALKHQKVDQPVRVVLDSNINPNAMQALNAINQAFADDIIDRSQFGGPGLALKIEEEISKGAMVGIMADRIYDHEPSIKQAFLGSTAEFPLGPWQLALLLKAPVILCFGIYLGANRYRLKFVSLPEIQAHKRAERSFIMESLCKRYVAEMENILNAHPLNWFNFYDFWKSNPAKHH